MKIFRTSSQPLKNNAGLAAVLLLGLVVLFQILVPAQWAFHCRFHQWTGLPCPTCGATRCLRMILHGEIGAAWKMQPLVFSASFLLGGLAAYSMLASIFKWRVLRVHFESRTEQRLAAALVAVLFIGNWVYLILKG
ncbi:MAG: DUF2752 domain-containing protein [Kiritimatiellales bacterium]|nr:DUF2752 domain-containing protein [Kiritimatiellales bacterium]